MKPFIPTLISILLHLVTFSSLSSAANTIKLINHCPYDIWFWTVGPKGSKIDGPDESRTTVPRNHGTVTHAMFDTERLDAGISLKIRDYPFYQVAPAGIVQVEYLFQPTRNAIWYDLSVINCNRGLGPESPSFCPLIAGGVTMHVPGVDADECPQAWCAHGKCQHVYDRHGTWWGEPSFRCRRGVDIHIETCTTHAGPRTFQEDPLPGVLSAPPPPPSSSSSSPAAPEEMAPKEQLKVSPAGLCGAATGFTCAGSRWGQCCSQWGYCGQSEEFCGAGCQVPFSVCNSK